MDNNAIRQMGRADEGLLYLSDLQRQAAPFEMVFVIKLPKGRAL